jgi:hypothetical protein
MMSTLRRLRIIGGPDYTARGETLPLVISEDPAPGEASGTVADKQTQQLFGT